MMSKIDNNLSPVYLREILTATPLKMFTPAKSSRNLNPHMVPLPGISTHIWCHFQESQPTYGAASRNLNPHMVLLSGISTHIWCRLQESQPTYGATSRNPNPHMVLLSGIPTHIWCHFQESQPTYGATSRNQTRDTSPLPQLIVMNG